MNTFWIILIPLSPLAGLLAVALFGRRIQDYSHRVTIPSHLLSFALSLAAFSKVLASGPVRVDLYTFIQVGNLTVDMSLYVDQLTCLLLILVTGISSLVHIFSSRYMQGDPRHNRFFAVLSLFIFAMLMLVMSANLLMLYFFWEVMGICSYLLISHWAERKSANEAATRVFLVNAVADVGLGLGVLLTFVTFGTLDIQQILAAAQTKVGITVNLLGWLGLEWPVELITLIALLFLLGAMGKSAQIPFHVWLPYAMEAPTPVSALIHAATLVKAGVFLVVRLSPLFILSSAAMNAVAIVGGLTALLAAIFAVTQSDIKKILAYSTMSQIGFMMMASGLGAFIAAVFHLLAHGAVKAFLFLSAGNAIQQLVVTRDLRYRQEPAGMLRSSSLYAGGLMMSCLPPVLFTLSGYGLIWWSARSAGWSLFFWIIILATSLLTALYLFRGISIMSQVPGENGQPEGHSARKQSPGRPASSVIMPVLLGSILAVGVLSLFLVFLWGGFVEFLSPAVAQSDFFIRVAHEPALSFAFLAMGISAAGVGWGLGYYFMIHPARLPSWMTERYKILYVFALSQGYFGEIYDALIIRPNLWFAHWLWRSVDIRVIERLVVGSGGGTVAFSRWLWRSMDIRVIERLVVGSGGGTVAIAHWLWRSVDIRGLSWIVDGLAQMSFSFARWLWQSVDIRGLEKTVIGIGRKNEAAGKVLREVEPSMLQHQLLVLIISLIVAMGLFFLFFL